MLSLDARCQVRITEETGLHLRLASRFARTASRFDSDVRVAFGERTADGKSVIDLLTLAAGRGAWLDLKASGADACRAVEALAELVASWTEEA